MLLAVAFVLAPAAAEEDVTLPRFPSISPDGSEITFSWRGDLWRVSADGGNAVRLTRHQLDDLFSSWSPDGEWIVFSSMRDGALNLWRIHRDGTRLTQLTHGDRHVRNPWYGLDEDGEPVITFSGLLEADVYRDERPYAVAPGGGEHWRLHDAFGSTPRFSPDGERLVFTRGGFYHGWERRHYRGPDAMDVWLHDRTSGEFRAVTERDGDDGNAHWMDDGTLVFMSDREQETVNLYRLALDAEAPQPQRLTDFDGRDVQHFDVARDGGTAVLHVWDTVYTLDLTDKDARPQPVRIRAGDDGRDRYQLKSIDREVTEAALSPDGKTMAYIAYGRVYVRHMDEHSVTRPVTRGSHARHKDLQWAPDGTRLYFTHDGDGTDSIYRARVALTREEIRRGPAPTEPRRPPATPEPVAPEEQPAKEPQQEPPPGDDAIADPGPDPDPPAAAPDDPFAPVDPGLPTDPPVEPEPTDPVDIPERPATGVEEPATPAPEEAVEPEEIPADLPTDMDPNRWHDGVQFALRPVVQTGHNDREARPSPDGRHIAFRRGRGDLVVMDLHSGDKHTVAESWDSTIHWRWSPDGRHIAYSRNDLNFSANIFIVPADGSAEPVNITRHPRNDLNPRWSADGRKLTFISNRSGDSYDLYRVYLGRSLERLSQRERAGRYRDARDAALKRKPLTPRAIADHEALPEVTAELELDTAWRRVQRITGSPRQHYANKMTPGGDRYVFNASGEGLVAVNWDGSSRQRLGPVADVQHLDVTGERVVYIANGRVGVAPLSGNASHQHPDISDRLRLDLGEQALQKFRETARMIGESFYRDDMKGLDWEGVTAEYESLIRRTRTASEFSDITNRFLGELAASHMGLTNPGPASALQEPYGRLGIDHEPAVSTMGRTGFRVNDVIAEGPAALASTPLRPGDVITKIDLEPFRADETLLERLRGRVDQEIIVTFERATDHRRQERRILLRPVGYADLARLRYDAFRDDSEALVHERSGGRLGYIHIQAMNQTSLEAFQGALYAAAEGRDGLIIDVRNNGGGHTTDRILTSIMAPDHAFTLPSGADPSRTGHYPQDRLDAPRYTLPINMLANEKSYSNAEILAHAFSTLDRGTLVGQQTYGGVISTGRHTLIDGAAVRRPFRGWYLPDGTDMEHHGAQPDLLVEQRPEDEVAGRDVQLKRAVDAMLERLDETEQQRPQAPHEE